MSGCQAGEGLATEVGEFLDDLIAAGEAFPECGDLGFEPVDLGVAGVGGGSGLEDGGEPGLELFAEVGVGACAVEGGAVDAGFAGEGLDVAFAAGWQVAVQEPVHGGADFGLVVVAGWAPEAVSIAVMTQVARS